jgi:hypothetical protein
MVDFTKFSNISDFVYNDTLTQNLTTINADLITNNNNLLGGFWINGVFIVLFLFIFWRLNDKQNPNYYDITRSLFIASSVCLLGSIFVLVSGWSSTIYPLYLYGVIAMITAMMVYNLKSKGL